MAKLTDDQIVSLIEAEESEALGGEYDELTQQRADALDRYNQRAYGWEVEGRSQFVSNTIRDCIEAIQPSVMRVFLSGDEVGRFDPVSEEDEQAAEVESLVVNHCVAKGGGWQAIYSATKDALLLKNGFIQVQWETDTSVSTETYTGQSDEELALLMADPEVKVIEHDERPMFPELPDSPLLHDVKVERTTPTEGLRLDAVPPDEVLISSRHRSVSLTDCDFVQVRTQKTIGELRDAGYDVPDDVADDEVEGPESVARARYDWDDKDDSYDALDPTRRRVLFRQTWIRSAFDGGKTPKLHRVCVVGKQIVHREEADLIPIAALSGIWYPHSAVGVSMFDLLADLAEAETIVSRQYFDSLYLSTAPRVAVDPERVNLDDLLVARPGGIVRVQGSPADAMLPIVSTDVGPTAQAGLEWIAQMRENRTGLARVNIGIDPNALNSTATGQQLMMSAGQARLEAICRLLAEGVKDLFLIAHAVLLKHSTKPIQLRLKNQWTQVHPREWTRRTDFSVSVALGTGTPEAQLMKLQGLSQQVPGLLQMGLMGPREVYNLAAETLRVSGYRAPDKFLIEPPEGAAMPQPGPPPEVQAAEAMAKGQVQKAAVDGQFKIQQAKGDSAIQLQTKQMEIDASYKEKLVDTAAKVLIEVYRQEAQAKAQAESQMYQQNHEAALQHMGGQMESMRAEREGDREDARARHEEAKDKTGEVQSALLSMVEQLTKAVNGLNAPREVVRGPDGRATGVRPVLMQ